MGGPSGRVKWERTLQFFSLSQKGHFELDFRVQLLKGRISNMAAITQIQNINDFIQAFLETHGVDSEVFDEWQTEKTQKAVESLMKTLVKAPPKEKKLKDPNAPKRGKSAYLFFCAEWRAKVKEDMGDDTKATEVTSALGVLWNDLKSKAEGGDKKAQKEMTKYSKQAEEDKERYTEEMSDYTPPSDEELAEIASKKKGAKGSGGKTKKDPGAPKRPKSAYLFFCADVREAVKAELDEPTAKDVMAELGVKWSELKANAEKDKKAKKEMDKYTKQAEEDKERYTVEMEAYTPPSSGDDDEVVPKAKKSPVKKTAKKEDDDEAKKVASPRKKSGYAMFCGEFRPEIKEDNPDKSGTEITKLLAQMWKDLPEEEKDEWKEKAAAE